MPSGEDRAFIDAVRAHDLIVRHAPDIEVITSGRLEGRASGGVADTMRLRCDVPEAPCDVRLERLGRVVARALVRRRLRSLYIRRRLTTSWLWLLMGIPPQRARELAELQGIGAVLEAVEKVSSRLDYQPIRPSELPRQIRNARAVLSVLRRFGPSFDAMPRTRPGYIDVVTPAKAATLSTTDVGTNNASSI